jgi:hypothetical protein
MSLRHGPGVPTDARLTGSDPLGEWSPVDDRAPAGAATSSGSLLRADGASSRGPALAPHRALALDALELLRRFGGTVAADAAWADPAFERQVEEVRHQLGPIQSRRALAASFEREAAMRSLTAVGESGRVLGSPGPVRLAYAVRWLELGDGESWPGWTRLMSGGARARRVMDCRLADRRCRSKVRLRR